MLFASLVGLFVCFLFCFVSIFGCFCLHCFVLFVFCVFFFLNRVFKRYLLIYFENPCTNSTIVLNSVSQGLILYFMIIFIFFFQIVAYMVMSIISAITAGAQVIFETISSIIAENKYYDSDFEYVVRFFFYSDTIQ